jgi:hypothetical protein
MTAPAGHAWTSDVRKGNPVLRCTNVPCRIVWWPDRGEPKSACTGAEPPSAAEVVRALIIGGAA